MAHIFFGKELNIDDREYNFLNSTWGMVVRHAQRAKHDFAYKVTFSQVAREVKAQLYGILQVFELQGKVDYEDADTIMKAINGKIKEYEEAI